MPMQPALSPRKHPVLSVAPMIDWTDRHCRFFHRLLAPHALLYTEMISTGAVLRGKRDRLLPFSPAEHPIALQLGGSDPYEMSESAKIAEDYGYDALNINCGCPSERVQKGSFGACLMTEPQTVAACIRAMKGATALPVTVKCRIGIDDSEDYPFLKAFILPLRDAGCDTFIIHARKAWLKGLSPKENREIPPLRYDIAARVKEEFPDLTVILNGGLKTVPAVEDALQTFDGVMIGREAYQNPWSLAELEQALFGTPLPDRFAVCRIMADYIAERRATDEMPIHSTTRHMLGLFNGMRGANRFRQILGGEAHRATSPHLLIEQALDAVAS